jgi:tetratricopeptide (TPR) repeat protein
LKLGAFMRSFIRLICVLLASAASCIHAYAGGDVLKLQVVDVSDRPVAGVALCADGRAASCVATDNIGEAMINLTAEAKSNREVLLRIMQTPAALGLVSLASWDTSVRIPLFEKQPQKVVKVVLAKQRDKQRVCGANVLPPDNRDRAAWRRNALSGSPAAFGGEPAVVGVAVRSSSQEPTNPDENRSAGARSQEHAHLTVQSSQAVDEKRLRLEEGKGALANAYFFLGQSLYGQKQYHEAAESFRKANALCPGDGSILNSLGKALLDVGDRRGAELYYQQALAIHSRSSPASHPYVIASLNNLANLYLESGMYVEAEALFLRASSVEKEILGHSRSLFANALDNYARLMQKTNRPAAATKMRKRAASVRSGQVK